MSTGGFDKRDVSPCRRQHSLRMLYLVFQVSVLLLEPVVALHVHELGLPPEQLVLLVHQVEQLHYQVLSLKFRI